MHPVSARELTDLYLGSSNLPSDAYGMQVSSLSLSLVQRRQPLNGLPPGKNLPPDIRQAGRCNRTHTYTIVCLSVQRHQQQGMV